MTVPKPEPTEILDLDMATQHVYYPDELETYGLEMRKAAFMEAIAICVEMQATHGQDAFIATRIAERLQRL